MIKIRFTDENYEYKSWWKNFDNYHDPLWKIYVRNLENREFEDSHSWNQYVSMILKEDIIHFQYPYLYFQTEEDATTFILRWS